MLRINKYSVSGFKNIKKAELFFDNFNIIVGPNNSGKSNFFQSISFINQIINGAMDENSNYFQNGFYTTHFGEVVPNMGLDKSKGSMEFDMEFYNSESNNIFRYHLGLEWKEKDFINVMRITKESLSGKDANTPGKPITFFSRSNKKVQLNQEIPKNKLIDDLPAHISLINILKLFVKDKLYLEATNALSQIIKTPIFYFSTSELSKKDVEEKVSYMNGRLVSYKLEDEILSLYKSPKWDILNEAVGNILDIDEIHVHTITYTGPDKEEEDAHYLFFFQFGKFKKLEGLSDGSKLIIALITKILSSDSDIFIIEEPENSTHPKALLSLLAFLKSFSASKQFIMSSHSIPILNKSKVDEIIVSCIGNDGFCEFYNVNQKADLKKRLSQSHINFSDELFFMKEEEEEFD